MADLFFRNSGVQHQLYTHGLLIAKKESSGCKDPPPNDYFT